MTSSLMIDHQPGRVRGAGGRFAPMTRRGWRQPEWTTIAAEGTVRVQRRDVGMQLRRLWRRITRRPMTWIEDTYSAHLCATALVRWDRGPEPRLLIEEGGHTRIVAHEGQTVEVKTVSVRDRLS